MTTWADIKPNPDKGEDWSKNAPGRRFFRNMNGILFMSLATNGTPWTAVNMETGDLKTMKDRDPVELVSIVLTESG